MSTQERLFDYAATRGASRGTDPATSRDAARSMSGPVLRDQQALVLRAVKDRCRFGKGATAYEVFELLDRDTPHGPKENVIAKRLGELRELGLLERTGLTRPGSSHREQQVHTLTDAGREAL